MTRALNMKTLPVLLIILAAVAVGALEGLGALPRTRHADAAHVLERWSPSSIQNFIAEGKCRPVLLYACPARDLFKYVCPVSEGSDLWVGLIVGMTDKVVITGWAARSIYWQGTAVRDQCNAPTFQPIIVVP
jgi:hypothetical protein